MYPEYVKVNGKKYKINTSFRVALECNRIAEDKTINDIERALAVIYKLFGEEALEDKENRSELLEKAKLYLSCGQEENDTNEKRDMDFNQDMPYIRASFMSDYHIDLKEKDMHFWEFFELINGLSNSDTGNCCVLNRIRNLRNFNLSEIKDLKEREKIRKAQQKVALNKKVKRQQTEEQKESAKDFYQQLYRKE